MPGEHPLEVLQERKIIRMRVARGLHHQFSAIVRGFLKGEQTSGVNQVPESWTIEIDHSAGEVHGRMVVEQAAPGEVDDRLGDCAFPRSGWSVKKEELHRSFAGARAPNTWFSGRARRPSD